MVVQLQYRRVSNPCCSLLSHFESFRSPVASHYDDDGFIHHKGSIQVQKYNIQGTQYPLGNKSTRNEEKNK